MLLTHGDLTIRDATLNDVPILMKWWNDGNVMAFEGFPNGYGISEEEIIQDLENERAQHVYEKLGFRKLGIHYDACENQVGELQSFVRYELEKDCFCDFS